MSARLVVLDDKRPGRPTIPDPGYTAKGMCGEGCIRRRVHCGRTPPPLLPAEASLLPNRNAPRSKSGSPARRRSGTLAVAVETGGAALSIIIGWRRMRPFLNRGPRDQRWPAPASARAVRARAASKSTGAATFGRLWPWRQPLSSALGLPRVLPPGFQASSPPLGHVFYPSVESPDDASLLWAPWPWTPQRTPLPPVVTWPIAAAAHVRGAPRPGSTKPWSGYCSAPAEIKTQEAQHKEEEWPRLAFPIRAGQDAPRRPGPGQHSSWSTAPQCDDGPDSWARALLQRLSRPRGYYLAAVQARHVRRESEPITLGRRGGILWTTMGAHAGRGALGEAPEILQTAIRPSGGEAFDSAGRAHHWTGRSDPFGADVATFVASNRQGRQRLMSPSECECKTLTILEERGLPGPCSAPTTSEHDLLSSWPTIRREDLPLAHATTCSSGTPGLSGEGASETRTSAGRDGVGLCAGGHLTEHLVAVGAVPRTQLSLRHNSSRNFNGRRARVATTGHASALRDAHSRLNSRRQTTRRPSRGSSIITRSSCGFGPVSPAMNTQSSRRRGVRHDGRGELLRGAPRPATPESDSRHEAAQEDAGRHETWGLL
ncbi:hypothetical protein ACCO45_012539 [Purpureocillium lilacinum]|uniref:Uncharacterized protein n=1 Tax=Purpureocillium lilacinum TaxID=33203 RepID=A0ACC4D8Q4_PURLI